MKSRLCAVVINFNNFAFTDARLTQPWIHKRLAAFMKYTYKSLTSQTCQDFYTFVMIDPQTTDIFEEELKAYPPLPKNIIFTAAYRSLLDIITDYDELYMIRLDSDDMYHPDFIQKLYQYEHKEDTQVLICTNGYIYDSLHNRLSTWIHPSPPFFTFIYNVKDYQAGVRYSSPKGHLGAVDFVHENITDPSFIVTIHTLNNSTSYTTKYNGREITDETERDAILQEFTLLNPSQEE